MVSSYSLELTNASMERYSGLKFEGLAPGASCNISYNFGQVATPGRYTLRVIGQGSKSATASADQVVVTLDLTPGF